MKNDKMKNQYRVNEQIRVREVRVVSEDGSQVLPTRQALDMARQMEVDLVEISPNAQPPVCRLIDYSKFLYQQKKHHKVRAYVFFRGRSILFKEQGEVLLLRFANDLEEYCKVEQLPKLEGKKMFLFLAPKKAGVAKKSQQKMDRERREAEKSLNSAPATVDTDKEVDVENLSGGIFANAKNGAEALEKLKK